MTFEENLKNFAAEIGIDLIGFTSAEPFVEAYYRLKKMQEKGYLSPWAEPDLIKRCYPGELMGDVVSIIAVGISYLQPDNLIPTEEKESDKSTMDKCSNLTGRLARFARYQDYHHILGSKMKEIVKWIQEYYPGIKAEIYVDTGPLIDREVAYRAGLGFIGKNSALIHPEYGSFIALGEILLNIPLKPNQPMANGCGDCICCLQSCPQQAIKAPGEIRSIDCLAHYTQEKGFLRGDIRKKLGSRLWGCDTCQDVCPYNRQAKWGSGILFKEHDLGSTPNLASLLKMSNKEYKELVGATAMAWRGKTTLQRNALINLGNLKNPLAIPVLIEALKDQRPVIRGVAAWAMGEIGDKSVKGYLEDSLSKEPDIEVREELNQAIGKLSLLR